MSDDAEGSARPQIPARKAGITRTPTKSDKAESLTTVPAKKDEPVSWIETDRKSRIVAALRKLEGESKKEILNDFKQKAHLSSSAVTPDHITTQQHGDLLETLLGLDPYVSAP